MAEGLEDLVALEGWIAGVAASLKPAQRRQLSRRIGQLLRRRNVQRIAAQKNPDGSRFEPRKKRIRERSRVKIRERSAPMFRKLRQTSYLGVQADADQVTVGFANPTVARLARVHHEGLRDRVSREKDAPVAQYPARRLLGMTEEDREAVMQLVLEAVKPG